jgi:hypothetical protein
MTDPMHQQLLGHLLGALDDNEHERLDALLERDEECCRELLRWRRRLTPLEAMRPDFEPPPGLAERTCRYVAASMSALSGSQAWGPRRRMTPCPVPPSPVARFGWLDVAAIVLLLAATATLVLPAIDGSRFQTRVAACQEGLRQFGLALSQYGHQQQDVLSRLACNGRLTDAGLFAAGLLRDEYSADAHRAVCPDAWLAAQGALRGYSSDGAQLGILQRPATVVAGSGPRLTPELPSRGARDVDNRAWLGTWRNGMTDGRQFPPTPAEVPLLADAPSADLPGQVYPSHGGRGRNVLFEDGRIGFLPSAASRDTADWLLSHGPAADFDVSTPVVLVGRR